MRRTMVARFSSVVTSARNTCVCSCDVRAEVGADSSVTGSAQESGMLRRVPSLSSMTQRRSA